MRTELLLLTSLAIAAPTPGRTFNLLAKERDNIGFVRYTPEQKVQVAQTMKNLLSIWVHQENKLEFYRKENPTLDPMPKVDEVIKKAANMTEKEFHYTFADIFVPLRDLQ
jgi:hypothetical protein